MDEVHARARFKARAINLGAPCAKGTHRRTLGQRPRAGRQERKEAAMTRPPYAPQGRGQGAGSMRSGTRVRSRPTQPMGLIPKLAYWRKSWRVACVSHPLILRLYIRLKKIGRRRLPALDAARMRHRRPRRRPLTATEGCPGLVRDACARQLDMVESTADDHLTVSLKLGLTLDGDANVCAGARLVVAA